MTAPTSLSTPSYVLDQSWYAERDRLRSLTELYDPTSLLMCEQLGLTSGWTCLDVGAGTGSLVEVLADRVGDQGLVVAADVDTRFLVANGRSNVEVLQLDITQDLPSRSDFDLVHCRLLLEHLPKRDLVLGNLVALLRPGGHLLIEDFDWATATMFDPDSALASRIATAVRTLMARAGYDPHYGRRLPRALAAAGLVDVRTRAQAVQVRGDTQHGIPQWQLLVAQLAPQLLSHELVTEADLEAFDALCHDEDVVCFAPLMVSTSGRRP